MNGLPDNPLNSGTNDVIPGSRRPARWPRIALWTLAVLLGIVAVAVIGASLLLRSQRFHNYVLTRVQQEASISLGVPVELQNYTLHFNGINSTADLYGLTVHGAAPYTNPPLLQLPHARIGARIVSLLRQKWYLSELLVDSPIVQLRVDSDGTSNLPRSHGNSNGVQPLFDLAIRHAQLTGGQIYYNDRQNSLDADFRNLALNAAFDPSRNLYAGQLAYSDAQLRSGAFEPIPHALSLQFEMTPSHLDLRQAELRSGRSTLAFTATVDDSSNPRLAAVYHSSVDASDLRRILHLAQLPTGLLQLDGHAAYIPNPAQPALNALTLEGTLRSDRLDFSLPGVPNNNATPNNGAQPLRTQARAIRASYALSNGNAELRSLTASLLSGTLDAQASLRNLTAEQLGTAHLKLSGISLADLKQLAAPAAANNLVLGGTVQATSDASWKGSLRTLLATADAFIDASARAPQPEGRLGPVPSCEAPCASPSTIPIAGQLHAAFRNSDQQLTLRQSFLRTPRTTLTFDGTAGQHSQMNLSANASDLHELESIAAIFSPPAQPLALYGTASFAGTLSGSISAPHLQGQLSASNLHLRGTPWKLLHAHLDATPAALEIQSGELSPQPAKGVPPGDITFSGRAQLAHWRFTPDSPIQLALNAQRLDASQLSRLVGLTTPVSGTLNAQLQLHGSALSPIGQGNLTLLHASVTGEPIQSVAVSFNGDGTALHANVNLSMPAGLASAVLTYNPKQRSYQAQLQAHNLQLDRLQTVKSRNLAIAGAMNLDATGSGTLDDPQLTATLQIPQLHAHGEVLDNLALHADVARHLATLTLQTRALNTQLTGHATVQLTGDFQAEANLDSQPIPLQPIFAAYAPDQTSGVTGQTELHATLRGPLRHRELIEAHLIVPELNLQYQKSVALALTAPIHADYVNGVLNLQRTGLRGTGTDLQFQGSVPVLDRSKPMALLLLGSVDLQLAQLFDPDVTSSGQLRFNINSYGARSDLNLQGAVQIVNANFAIAGAPLGVSNATGTLALTPDRLNITNFSATMGGGKVTARGGLLFRPALQFDVVLSCQGIRMLYPDGVRQGLSADLTLTGNPAQATLRGQVNVDQLSFTPDFDLSSLSSFGNGVEEPPSRGFAANLQLNVALRSSQNVNLVSRTMSASGAANLRVTGTAAQPVVLGRINLTSGDLLFQGNRYVLQSAVVDFVNPSRTDPNVNASVTTTIQQYNIGIRFEGPVDQLRASYSSNPALPPADIINLIAFGKTQEAANATATTANQTAEQSIASAVSGQVTSRLQKIAGLSYLSVDPTLGNSQQNAGATVTVQQRVTSKIFVTYSSDVTSTQPLQQVIQLQYQATPTVSLTGTRDQNGGFALETRITRNW